ncbi:MAG: TRAP transporter small permease subunit [Beijerinckiaceae bacterium]
MSGAGPSDPPLPSNRFAAGLLTVLRPVTALASIAGTIWIFVIMMLINADVAGTQALNAPVPGVPEIVAQSIVGIVFLQLADAQQHGRLIRSDVFLTRILSRSPAGGRLLLSFHNLAGAVLMGLVCWFTLPRLINAWTNEEYVGTVGTFTFPLWPIAGIIVFSSALSAIYYLVFMTFPDYARSVELEGSVHE